MFVVYNTIVTLYKTRKFLYPTQFQDSLSRATELRTAVSTYS